MRPMLPLIRLAIGLAIVCGLSGTVDAQTAWVPTDLGTLGGNNSYARGINNAGQVVGDSQVASGATHAFLWTAVSGMVDLGTLGGTNSYARAINDAGQVVGYSETGTGAVRAFRWTAADGMVDLGAIGCSSAGFAINNLGQVSGEHFTSCGGGLPLAMVWTASGGMVNLGTLGSPGSEYSGALANNDAGQVVGYSTSLPYGLLHPFLWTAATGMVDLDIASDGQGFAEGINNAGQVVGTRVRPSQKPLAFLWTAVQGAIDLGTLGGGESYARAINDLGHVVGDSVTANNARRAFFWTPTDGMVGLDGLWLYSGTIAVDVNDVGEVAWTPDLRQSQHVDVAPPALRHDDSDGRSRRQRAGGHRHRLPGLRCIRLSQ